MTAKERGRASGRGPGRSDAALAAAGGAPKVRPMRLSTLNSLVLGLLLAIAVASALLTLWHSRESRIRDERIVLAQSSYAEHLALQSNVNRLFKQHGDALLFGDLDEGLLEDEIERAIAGNLSAIRTAIAREIELVGEEEIEELELLARIEAKVRSLTQVLGRFAADGAPLDAAVRRERLIELMDREIDDHLAALISEALAGEREEVVEALAEAAGFRSVVRRAAYALIVLSLAFTTAAAIAYRGGVVAPARRAMDTIRRHEAGDLSPGEPIGGVEEMRRIGEVLARMANGLREREASRAEQTARLEAAVAERTAELSRALSQIERAERSRRRMMADVSHELRTPLTIIRGEADVALRAFGADPAGWREALDRIRETSRHANAIVDDLLTISRQEAGALRLDLAEVDLAELLRRTVELAGRPVEIAPIAGPARVRADPVRIRQCLLALLQNAFRYGGSDVRAGIAPVQGGFRLYVEDDGPGMSDAEKAEAFERFFRGSNAGAAPEGTGLGLPIVRAIAAAHGGSAGLDDRPGGGLRAWIETPAERGVALVSDRGAAPRRPAAGGGR